MSDDADSIDRAVLRKLAEGWLLPTMTVEIQAQVLSALLDEHDRLLAEVERLEQVVRQRGDAVAKEAG